ncbi:MAG: ATP-binding protein [Zetaproteobacteria bacterium]|nr:MAG: ATP-binding protein [Zetaproteobacteria bacterium]
MAFVAGPRQVGKTTTCQRIGTGYLNWDNADHRRVIVAGPEATAERVGLQRLHAKAPILVFDELHKYGRWKGFLKGFFDTYGERAKILVTGSSRLDVYRRGGDSLLGRYFLFRMHPFTVGEIARVRPPAKNPIQAPVRIPEKEFGALWTHGGYPEPLLRQEEAFTLRWRSSRNRLLLREDIRDLTQIRELGQIELLGTLLGERSGASLVYSNLAKDLQTSVDTVRRWVGSFCALHYGFLVRPWFQNVARALRKEPKWFLRDWSGIQDPGARAETFVACHLLKSVEGWEDLGIGEFELRYVRDREKREVDFLIVRNRKPWCLVEVKSTETSLNPWLAYFQKSTGAPHAFQAVFDLEYEDVDCFSRHDPAVVPMRTLLSQLL